MGLMPVMLVANGAIVAMCVGSVWTETSDRRVGLACS